MTADIANAAHILYTKMALAECIITVSTIENSIIPQFARESTTTNKINNQNIAMLIVCKHSVNHVANFVN